MKIEIELTADQEVALSDALWARAVTLADTCPGSAKAHVMNQVAVALLELMDFPTSQWMRDSRGT